MNSVQYILKNRPLSHQDKILIKQLGRPEPLLQMKIKTVGKSRDFNRYFKKETAYDRFQWMCGCLETNKLFCFVCLVVADSDAKISQWTNTGVTDLQHLQERATRHAESTTHLSHLVDFNLLGATDVQKQLNSDYLKTVDDHNEKVDKNRRTLRRVITCLKFSGAFELELFGNDSQEQGVFHGLLDFVSELDYSSEHLNQATVLQKDSKSIQSELLDAMLQVCKNEIIGQVRRANFVALIVEKTENCQLVVVFRYFLDGQIFERLWDVVELEDYTAKNISEILLRELDALGVDTNKLITQSSNVPYKIFGEVETIIKAEYSNVSLVHGYCHHFKIVLENAAFGHNRVYLFFALVQGFERFFSHFPQRISVLDKLIQQKLPWMDPRTWNFETGIIKELHGKTELFRDCLEKIIDDTTHMATVSAASHLLKFLECEDFNYFLEVIYPIVPHVEMFFNQLQSQGADRRFVLEQLNELESRIFEFSPNKMYSTVIYSVDDEFDEIQMNYIKREITHEWTEESTPDSKRRRVEQSEMSEEYYQSTEMKIEVDIDEISKMDASTSKLQLEADHTPEQKVVVKEYCTSLITELKELYNFTGHVSAAALFCSDMFPTYKHNFPDSTFEETVAAYPYIDRAKLKTELTVVYSRKDMTCSGFLPLLAFIHRNNLQEGFSETYKLLDIICTTPMITVESERCFSTMKRIRSFLTNAGSREKLGALAMLSVEKKMVQSILDFDDKVINIFAENKNRAEFKYL